MKAFLLASTLGGVLLLAGCASTQQARTVQTDSFLAPYAHLLQQDGNDNRALLHYNKPGTDWAAYDKIQLLPVKLLTDEKGEKSAEQKQELQQLVDGFSSTLYQKLAKDYGMVQTPQPDTLQMQVAISHGDPSEAGLAFISRLPGPQRLLSTLYSKVSGTPAFSGGITLELVIKDAQSGTLLAAAADRQVGGMHIAKPHAFDSWGDVENALQFYANSIAAHLCKARGGDSCQEN